MRFRSWVCGTAAAGFAVLGAGEGIAGADEATRPIASAITASGAKCFDSARLAASVARWLGRDTIDARLTIEAGDEGEARFTLRRDGRIAGSRTLAVSGAPCEDVRAALGLAIAVALDATVLTTVGIADPSEIEASSSDPGGGADPQAAARDTVPSRDGVAKRDTARPGSGAKPGVAPGESVAPVSKGASFAPHFTIALNLGVAVELLPSPSFVGIVAAEMTVLPRLFVRAGLIGTSPQDVPVPPGGATVQLLAGSLDACTRGALGPVDGRACLGAAVGSLSAHGFGFARSHDASGPWAALEARAGARLRISRRFGIDAEVLALAPPYRVHLDVRTSGATTTSVPLPPVGIAITAGPSVLLW